MMSLAHKFQQSGSQSLIDKSVSVGWPTDTAYYGITTEVLQDNAVSAGTLELVSEWG